MTRKTSASTKTDAVKSAALQPVHLTRYGGGSPKEKVEDLGHAVKAHPAHAGTKTD